MRKIKLFWYNLFFVFFIQITVFSQTNTSLPASANPSDGGTHTTAIGANSLSNNTNSYNTGIGFSALKNNTFGNRNTAVGAESSQNNISGEWNVSVGHQALFNGISGNSNVAIGRRSMSGFNNGPTLISSNTGSGNVAVGYQSLNYNTSGSHNVALGYRASLNNESGQYNTALGAHALNSVKNGSFNIGIGYEAINTVAESTSSFSNNIGIGTGSLKRISNGNNNIGIGRNAGHNFINGSYNVFIGVSSGIVDPSLTYNSQLFIHSNDGSAVNNPLIWGSFSSRQLRFNVSANTNSRLEITATGTRSGLRFNNLNDTFIPTITSTKFLTVNNFGDVELRNLPLSAGGEDTSIYSHDGTLQENRTVFMDNNRLMFNTANEGRIYIGNTTNVTDNENFPTETGNYRLYVEGGILTEKVKVALRNPDTNWADYVFADDYQLKSLKEVETFIKENRHLPGIESAQELVENGLDLGVMQAKQMGKIEELTLYIIEQDKKLEQQSKDIEELKALVKVLIEKK